MSKLQTTTITSLSGIILLLTLRSQQVGPAWYNLTFDVYLGSILQKMYELTASFLPGALLTIIMAIVLTHLFMKIIQNYMPAQAPFAGLFLILNPVFASALIFFPDFIWLTFFLVTASYFLLKQNKLKYLSPLLFAPIPLFNLTGSIIAATITATYAIIYKQKHAYLSLLVIALTSLVVNKPFIPYLFSENPLNGIIIDFGALTGITLFTLLLAIIGIVKLWKADKIQYVLYVLLGVLTVSSFLNNQFTYLANYLLAFYAAVAFSWLFTRNWRITIIKNLTLLIIAYGLLFSTISFQTNLAITTPSQSALESYEWLDNNLEKGFILASPEQAPFISFYTNQTPYLSKTEKSYETRKKVDESIFSSRDVKSVTEFLNRENIKTIWIDQKFKNDPKNEDLLFVLSNERFKRVYDREDVEIWQIKDEM